MSNPPSDDSHEATVIISRNPPPGRPAPPPRHSDLAVGHVLAGRFRIKRPIGAGGMGSVYLASDEQLARFVAIKTIPFGADPVLEARFRREARLIAELKHPNIVEIVDFGQSDGLLYLAMELIAGESLTALLQRDGAPGLERAVAIALQVAEALAAAHVRAVVHRDIKPDNIMVNRDADGRDRVKVIDFGVAKIVRDARDVNATVQTMAGKIVGSLRYISPEQIESDEVTPRTDMYLFGCVVYELLTGRRVFEYRAPADCAIAHHSEKPKRPEVPGVTLPRALVDFVMRCLEKHPDARPADAREAIAVLSERM